MTGCWSLYSLWNVGVLPVRWWSFLIRCSSCISQAGAWACGWSWSYIRTWENDGSDTSTSLPRHERTLSVNPIKHGQIRETLALFSQLKADLTDLHFFHHLLPERADFGWDGDGHVLRAAVLTADSVEGARSILNAAVVQIRLREKNKLSTVVQVMQQATRFKLHNLRNNSYNSITRQVQYVSKYHQSAFLWRFTSHKWHAHTQNLTRKKAFWGPFSYSSLSPPVFSGNLS